MFLGFGHSSGERSGIVKSVRVGEEQPFRGDALNTADERVVLAANAWARLTCCNHAHSGKSFSNGASAVSGIVVNDGDMEVNSLLGGDRGKAARQAVFFIARRDDDFDLRLGLRGHAYLFIIGRSSGRRRPGGRQLLQCCSEAKSRVIIRL